MPLQHKTLPDNYKLYTTAIPDFEAKLGGRG